MSQRTRYATLTLKELVQLHRWDIQGDDLVEELWQRLERFEALDEPIETLEGIYRMPTTDTVVSAGCSE